MVYYLGVECRGHSQTRSTLTDGVSAFPLKFNVISPSVGNGCCISKRIHSRVQSESFECVQAWAQRDGDEKPKQSPFRAIALPPSILPPSLHIPTLLALLRWYPYSNNPIVMEDICVVGLGGRCAADHHPEAVC
jgi:hypothetical protein